MAEIIKQATGRNIPFWVCLSISIALLVGAFFVPPQGQIDGSVLTAVGEMFGFAALWTVWLAIKKGVDARVTHGKTSLTVGSLDGNDLPIEENIES